MKLRIAHISDPHFTSLSWKPQDWLCKRVLAQLNYLFTRSGGFTEARQSLPDYLKDQNIDAVIVSGDLTTSGTDAECKQALKWLERFNFAKKVLSVPGNHDAYTARPQNSGYFSQLADLHLALSKRQEKLLFHKRLTYCHLNENWLWVGIDLCLPTSWISSQGLFDHDLEKNLENFLSEQSPQTNILLTGHFPYHPRSQKKYELLRKEAFQKLLERFPNVKLYLHGHTHDYHILDGRPKNLPLSLDCGSCFVGKRASFCIIEIDNQQLRIIPHFYTHSSWQARQTLSYQLDSSLVKLKEFV